MRGNQFRRRHFRRLLGWWPSLWMFGDEYSIRPKYLFNNKEANIRIIHKHLNLLSKASYTIKDNLKDKLIYFSIFSDQCSSFQLLKKQGEQKKKSFPHLTPNISPSIPTYLTHPISLSITEKQFRWTIFKICHIISPFFVSKKMDYREIEVQWWG